MKKLISNTAMFLMVMILSLTACVQLSSCIFRPIECRDMEMEGEFFWFSEAIGDTVIFVSDSEDSAKFTVVRKEARHTTHYISDTGCNCEDFNEMELVMESDTILLQRLSSYTGNSETEYLDLAGFLFDGDHAIFKQGTFQGHRDLQIDSLTFENCVYFWRDYSSGRRVKSFYALPGIGIIQYSMQDGMTWTNEDLLTGSVNSYDSYDIEEVTCQ